MARKPIAFPLCIECGLKRVPVWDTRKAALCPDCVRATGSRAGFFTDGTSIRDYTRRKQLDREREQRGTGDNHDAH